MFTSRKSRCNGTAQESDVTFADRRLQIHFLIGNRTRKSKYQKPEPEVVLAAMLNSKKQNKVKVPVKDVGMLAIHFRSHMSDRK